MLKCGYIFWIFLRSMNQSQVLITAMAMSASMGLNLSDSVCERTVDYVSGSIPCIPNTCNCKTVRVCNNRSFSIHAVWGLGCVAYLWTWELPCTSSWGAARCSTSGVTVLVITWTSLNGQRSFSITIYHNNVYLMAKKMPIRKLWFIHVSFCSSFFDEHFQFCSFHNQLSVRKGSNG